MGCDINMKLKSCQRNIVRPAFWNHTRISNVLAKCSWQVQQWCSKTFIAHVLFGPYCATQNGRNTKLHVRNHGLQCCKPIHFFAWLKHCTLQCMFHDVKLKSNAKNQAETTFRNNAPHRRYIDLLRLRGLMMTSSSDASNLNVSQNLDRGIVSWISPAAH